MVPFYLFIQSAFLRFYGTVHKRDGEKNLAVLDAGPKHSAIPAPVNMLLIYYNFICFSLFRYHSLFQGKVELVFFNSVAVSKLNHIKHALTLYLHKKLKA